MSTTIPSEREQNPEQERSFHELREEFRAANLARIRATLSDSFIEIDGRRWKIMADSARHEMPKQDMIEALSATVGSPEKCPIKLTFGLERVPETMRYQLHAKAEESITFDAVEIPGGVDHDGPPLRSLTEQDVLNYMEALNHDRK